MKQVRISELKKRLSKYLRSVEAGEIVEVTDRERPIARVVPLEHDGAPLELIPAEQSFASVRNIRLPRAKIRMSSLEALRLERGTR